MKTRSGHQYHDAGSHASDGDNLRSSKKGLLKPSSLGVTKKTRKPKRPFTKKNSTHSRRAPRTTATKKELEPFPILELPAEIRLVIYDHVIGENYSHEVVLHPSLTEEGSEKTWMMTRPRNQGPDIYNLALTNKQVHEETIKHVYKAINVKLDFPSAAKMANVLHENLIAGIRPELIKKIDVSLPVEPGMHVSFQKLLDVWHVMQGKLDATLTLMSPSDSEGFFSEVIQKEQTRAGRQVQRAKRDAIILRSIEQTLAPIWKGSVFNRMGEWSLEGDLSDLDKKLLVLIP